MALNQVLFGVKPVTNCLGHGTGMQCLCALMFSD